jgi:hypothetical protein
MIPKISSDCFPKQHSLVGPCNGDAVLPVRKELNFYILFVYVSGFKGFIVLGNVFGILINIA